MLDPDGLSKDPTKFTDAIHSHHEIKVDTALVLSQVNGTLGSVNVAIGRLLAKGDSQSAKLAQFETVRGQLLALQSAAENPGSASFEALSSMAAAITANFSFEEDSSASDNQPADILPPKPVDLSPSEMDKKVAEDPLMLALIAQGMQLEQLSATNHALEAHAVSSANDANTDVAIAIHVASMLHSGKSEDEVKAYLDATQTQMEAAMIASDAYKGAPGAAIANAAERIKVIGKSADDINEAMANGQGATQEALFNVTENIVDMHARHFKAHSLAHSEAMLKHLKGHVSEKDMAQLERGLSEFENGRHDKHHLLKDGLQALRKEVGAGQNNALPQGDTEAYLNNMLHSSGMSDVLQDGVEYGHSHAHALHKHTHLIESARESNLLARAGYNSALRGENHADMDAVARGLGISKDKVVESVVHFQNDNNVPFESQEHLNAQLAAINQSMSAGQRQWQGMLRGDHS